MNAAPLAEINISYKTAQICPVFMEVDVNIGQVLLKELTRHGEKHQGFPLKFDH
jgi:hypothetical protein